MERDQLLAIVVITVVIAGAGIALMIEPIENTSHEPSGDNLKESYIIADGYFDFVDVYTIDSYDGGNTLQFQNHITESGYTYEMSDPDPDYGDKNYLNDRMYRLWFWICIDGNLTDYWFPVSDDIVYHITILDIDFTIYINEYDSVW